MPKIKDLGINVIPETMQPPEIGGGGGCGCSNNFTIAAQAAACAQPSLCICTLVSPHCTAPHSLCLGCSYITPHCTGPLSITGCGYPSCGFVTPTLCGGCTVGINPTVCACTHIGSICTTGSPTVFTVTPTTPQQQPGGGVTTEQINALREQLNQQLSSLDEIEKQIGPKTAEELDAREKQLNDELAKLKTRRSELSKKK